MMCPQDSSTRHNWREEAVSLWFAHPEEGRSWRCPGSASANSAFRILLRRKGLTREHEARASTLPARRPAASHAGMVAKPHGAAPRGSAGTDRAAQFRLLAELPR